MTAQFILLILMFLDLCLYLSKNGEPKDDTYSFLKKIINTAILVTILYCGGFWDVLIN